MHISMAINAVFTDPHTEAQIVILQDRRKQTTLPIWIGASEAQTLQLAMENIPVPRPLTHDLLKAFLTHLNITLEKVVIRDVQQNTYYASLYFKPLSTPVTDGPATSIEAHRESFIEEMREGDTDETMEPSQAPPTEFKMDARPSDALILSLRYSTPIYVSKKVLDRQKVSSEFAAWLTRAHSKDSESSYPV